MHLYAIVPSENKGYEATAHYLTTHQNSNDLAENSKNSSNFKRLKNSKNCKKNVKKRGARIKKCPVCQGTFEFIKHLGSQHFVQGQMYHRLHNQDRKTREWGYKNGISAVEYLNC